MTNQAAEFVAQMKLGSRASAIYLSLADAHHLPDVIWNTPKVERVDCCLTSSSSEKCQVHGQSNLCDSLRRRKWWLDRFGIVDNVNDDVFLCVSFSPSTLLDLVSRAAHFVTTRTHFHDHCWIFSSRQEDRLRAGLMFNWRSQIGSNESEL